MILIHSVIIRAKGLVSPMMQSTKCNLLLFLTLAITGCMQQPVRYEPGLLEGAMPLLTGQSRADLSRQSSQQRTATPNSDNSYSARQLYEQFVAQPQQPAELETALRIVDPSGLGVMVPPGTKVDLDYHGFCLDSGLPAPGSGEKLRLVSSDGLFAQELQPVYQAVMNYANSHKVERSQLQGLLWSMRATASNTSYDRRLNDYQINLINAASPGAYAIYQRYAFQQAMENKAEDMAIGFLKQFAGQYTAPARGMLNDVQRMVTTYTNTTTNVNTTMANILRMPVQGVIPNDDSDFTLLTNGVAARATGNSLNGKISIVNDSSVPFVFQTANYVGESKRQTQRVALSDLKVKGMTKKRVTDASSMPLPVTDKEKETALPVQGVDITSRPSLTIITHGYGFTQGEDRKSWQNALASAISARASGNRSAAEGGDVPIYQLTIKSNAMPNSAIESHKPNDTEQLPSNFLQNVVHNGDAKSKNSAIVIVDWSDVDGGHDISFVPGNAGLAGTAVPTDKIARLIANYILRSPDAMTLPIHLIGHSRGGSVMLSLATILAKSGLWVEQLTTLDPHPMPHDFEGGKGITDDDPFKSTNRDLNTEHDHLSIPNNVIFADNYRQWADTIHPEGHILDGALEVDLSELLKTPNKHSEVHDWYHFTTDLNASSFMIDGDATNLQDGWYVANSRTTKGFNISRQNMSILSWRTLCNNSPNAPCGLHEEISGKPAPRFPVDVDSNNARPSILIEQVLNPNLYFAGPLIRVGDQLEVSVYYFAPVNPAFIVMNLDDDMNPFNDPKNPPSGTCQSLYPLGTLKDPDFKTTTQTIGKTTLKATLDVPLGNPGVTADKSCFIRVTIKDEFNKRIDYAQRAITIRSNPQVRSNPQGKIDPVVNNVIPSANLKAKETPPAGCNSNSNAPALGNGGAQGALKKFGSSKGGC